MIACIIDKHLSTIYLADRSENIYKYFSTIRMLGVRDLLTRLRGSDHKAQRQIFTEVNNTENNIQLLNKYRTAAKYVNKKFSFVRYSTK